MYRRIRRSTRIVEVPLELATIIVNVVLQETVDNYVDRRARLLTLVGVCRTFYYAASAALHTHITFPVWKASSVSSTEKRAQDLLIYLLNNARSLRPVREFNFVYDMRPLTEYDPKYGKESYGDAIQTPERGPILKIDFLQNVPNPWKVTALAALTMNIVSSPELHTVTFGAHANLYSYRHLSEYGYYMGSAFRSSASLRVLKFRNMEHFPREFVIGPFVSPHVRELQFDNATPDWSPRMVDDGGKETRTAVKTFSQIESLTVRRTGYGIFQEFLYSCLPRPPPRQTHKISYAWVATTFFTKVKTLTITLPTAPKYDSYDRRESRHFSYFMGGFETPTLRSLNVEDFGKKYRSDFVNHARGVDLHAMPGLRHLKLSCAADRIEIKWKLQAMAQMLTTATYDDNTKKAMDCRIRTITLDVHIEYLVQPWDKEVPSAHDLCLSPISTNWAALDEALCSPRLKKLDRINLNLKLFYWTEPDHNCPPKIRIKDLTIIGFEEVINFLLPKASRRPEFSQTFERIDANITQEMYLGQF